MQTFKRWFIGGIFLVSILAPFLKPASAAEYPMVANLKKFTAETDYMSQPGYLRYLVFLQDNTWISRHQSVSIVKQQMATSSY